MEKGFTIIGETQSAHVKKRCHDKGGGWHLYIKMRMERDRQQRERKYHSVKTSRVERVDERHNFRIDKKE